MDGVNYAPTSGRSDCRRPVAESVPSTLALVLVLVLRLCPVADR